jgi:hypothetical protein
MSTGNLDRCQYRHRNDMFGFTSGFDLLRGQNLS